METYPFIQAPFSSSSFSLEDLASRHLEFRSRSWEGHAPSEIGASFMECYGILPIVTVELKKAGMRSDKLYRARWIDPGEDPSDISTYCYPRQPEKQVLNRANLPGTPVFYTCGDPTTALEEVKPRGTGQAELMRSKWRFTDDRPWLVAPMIGSDKMHMLDRSFQEDWDRSFKEFILKAGTVPQEYLVLLRSCVAELFLSDSYEISSWIAHQIMEEHRSADVMVYPSSITGGQDLCQAFRAAPIDEGRVELEQVQQLQPVEDNYMILRIGIARGNVVEWLEADLARTG